MAGHRDQTQEICEALSHHVGDLDYEIYGTKGPLDATRFVKEWCGEHPADAVRFYACGGDGTANEVAKGVLGQKNASFTIYPCGSGNDFVKYYGGKERFLNLENLINGTEHTIDGILANDHLGINTVSFGFDSAVCKLMNRIKRVPIIGGKMAYYSAVLCCLFYAMHTKCTVKADGEVIAAKEILLCTAANGQYVGGSFRCAPRARNDDGLLEVCSVRPISILRVPELIGDYAKGTHLDKKKFQKIVAYRRSRKVEVTANGAFWVSVDGELFDLNPLTIEILPGALRFAVPAEAK